MDEAQPVWERFVACTGLTQPTFQTSQQSSGISGGGGILGTRCLNLSSSSIALSASSAALMREFTVRPVAELLSDKALQELASRNRLVDYLRACLKNRTRDATGHPRVQAIAVAGIEVSRSMQAPRQPFQQQCPCTHVLHTRVRKCVDALAPARALRGRRDRGRANESITNSHASPPTCRPVLCFMLQALSFVPGN